MTMKIDWMRGCATALVTPFTADGAFDEDRMRALVDRQINGGVKLLVPCGTTGESATMTEEEDARVIATTIDVASRPGESDCRGREATQRHPQLSIRNARAISALTRCCKSHPGTTSLRRKGCMRTLARLPTPFRKRPIMLYNVPGRTSSNIAAAYDSSSGARL
jgi:4-hydroxy-tetrahydrodipicolinate synthase